MRLLSPCALAKVASLQKSLGVTQQRLSLNLPVQPVQTRRPNHFECIPRVVCEQAGPRCGDLAESGSQSFGQPLAQAGRLWTILLAAVVGWWSMLPGSSVIAADIKAEESKPADSAAALPDKPVGQAAAAQQPQRPAEQKASEQDTTKQDTAKQDSAKEEPETVKQQPAGQQADKQDTAKQDTANRETVEQQTAKQQDAKQQATEDKSTAESVQPGAQLTEAEKAEIARLIEQLGDDSPSVRCEAEKRLGQFGLKAKEELLAGLKHRDVHVRRLCRWILADVLEADFQRRLAAFRADAEDKHDYQIPCWDRFKRLTGGGPAAKALFLEMLQAEGALLESAAAGPAAAAEGFRLRMQQVMQRMHGTVIIGRNRTVQPSMPSLATVATLLFLAAEPEFDVPEHSNYPNLFNVIQQQTMIAALKEGPYKEPLRRLLGRWMVRPTTVNLLHAKLNLAVQFDIKEGLLLALRTFKDKQLNQPHYRIYALSAIGRLGGKQYAGIFQPLLEDQSELFRGAIVRNKNVTVQVRDVALAWLIYLTDQDHEAYGMPDAKREFENVKRNQYFVPNYPMLGFSEAAQRDSALAKWAEYVKSNPLPEVPEDIRSEMDKPLQLRAEQPVGLNLARRAGDVQMFQGVSAEFADREQMRKLRRARELCEKGLLADAVPLLAQILAAPKDLVFQPIPGVGLLRCLKPEAETLIAQLPPAGRALYELLCSDEARQKLQSGINSGDARLLAEVSAQFFFTQAGAEATYLLALRHIDRGEPLIAALLLSRLRQRSWHADQFEPALSVTLAQCFAQLGMAPEADRVLRDLAERSVDAQLLVAGRQKQLLSQAQESLAWLESLLGKPARQAATGWLMFRGDPGRNAISKTEGLLLRGKRLADSCGSAALASVVQGLGREHVEQFRVALPRLYPLVVDNMVLARTATELVALDLADGRQLWSAPLEDALRAQLEQSAEAAGRLQTEAARQALRRRLWDDFSFGAISSDGRYVFGVEDLPFGFSGDYPRMVVGPDGRRRLDTDALKQYNLLAAYDLRTGKLRWELGGPPGQNMRPLAGAYFLGPPLPLGGRLYVVAEINNETRLLELEAESAKLLASIQLAVRDPLPSQWQMQMFWGLPPWMLANFERRGASMPAAADGVLVCRTGDSQYMAISLVARSILWVYQVPEADEPANPWMMGAIQRRKLLEAASPDQANRWADDTPTIAQGRVLLTPQDSHELLCLDLYDGRLLWTAPRRDGIYLGGVVDDRVIVVGRGGVWALNLADGQPVWQADRLPLPAGSLPSGFGLLTKDYYLLPLTSGEVATFDIRQGRLVSRSRSPDGIVPENLVACNDVVLSHGVSGLWRFDTLASTRARLEEQLKESPGNVQLLAEYCEVLLGQGEIAEAVETLTEALQRQADSRLQQLLAQALMDGLQSDFERFAPLARKIDAAIERGNFGAGYLRALAAGLKRTGRYDEAMQVLVKLVDDQQQPELLERVEPSRVVRRDRWLAGQIAEVLQKAPAEQRAAIDRLVGELAAKADPQRFLTYFGEHPAANQLRLKLAQAALEGQDKQPLRAEMLWREVYRTGTDQQQREAIARLALLLREAKLYDDAALCFEHLRTQLADVACLDAKTGRQLFEQLPADDPVRLRLTKPFAWPAGRTNVEFSNKREQRSQLFAMTVRWDDDRFSPLLTADVDMQNRRIKVFDPHGRRRWELAMGDKDNQWNFINWPDAYNLVCPVGHLAMVWLGNRVAAIDTLRSEDVQVLWTQPTSKTQEQLANLGMIFGMRMRMQPPALVAAELPPMVANHKVVCFLQGSDLVALDPLTGQTLWRREDGMLDGVLFGDGQMLFLSPPDGTEAVVLRAIDGQEIGRRRVPPARERLWTIGRCVATFKAGRLTMYDPWEEKTLWQQAFDPNAQVWLVDGREAATLDDQGRFTVVSLADGQIVLAAQLDSQPELEGLFVQRNSTHYIVATKRPAAGDGRVFFGVQNVGQFPVTGQIYGVDRRTGRVMWSASVQRQAVKINQPAEVPVLALLNQVQLMENNQYRVYMAMQCLDKRTGEELYSSNSRDHHSNVYEMTCNPEAGSVEIQTMLGHVKITYSDQPSDK